MKAHRLNPKWRTFAEKVALGMTATDAYLESGFAPGSRNTARRAGSRLSHKPQVAAYIRKLRQTAASKARRKATLALREKLTLLTRIVKTSAALTREDDQLRQTHRTFKNGSQTTRLPCKLEAVRRIHHFWSAAFPKERSSEDVGRVGISLQAQPLCRHEVPKMWTEWDQRACDPLILTSLQPSKGENLAPPSPQAHSLKTRENLNKCLPPATLQAQRAEDVEQAGREACARSKPEQFAALKRAKIWHYPSQ